MTYSVFIKTRPQWIYMRLLKISFCCILNHKFRVTTSEALIPWPVLYVDRFQQRIFQGYEVGKLRLECTEAQGDLVKRKKQKQKSPSFALEHPFPDLTGSIYSNTSIWSSNKKHLVSYSCLLSHLQVGVHYHNPWEHHQKPQRSPWPYSKLF